MLLARRGVGGSLGMVVSLDRVSSCATVLGGSEKELDDKASWMMMVMMWLPTQHMLI